MFMHHVFVLTTFIVLLKNGENLIIAQPRSSTHLEQSAHPESPKIKSLALTRVNTVLKKAIVNCLVELS